MNRLVTLVARLALASAMFLTALAGLLLLAAIEASSGTLPVQMLPEVVLVMQTSTAPSSMPCESEPDRRREQVAAATKFEAVGALTICRS